MNDDEHTTLERDLIAANKQLLGNMAFRDLAIVWIDASDGNREEYAELLATMMMKKAMGVFTRPNQ